VSVTDDMHAERAYRQMMQSYAGDKARAAKKLGLKPDGRGGYVDPQGGRIAKAAAKGVGRGLLRLATGPRR
jgi:hypothetical protein